MTTLPRTIGPYRLEQKLGAGGMGVVYRAVDTSLDRVVAIKMMHARELLGDDVDLGEVQTRFLREARAAARIKSRHVAQVLQLGTTDEGEAYIVMELLHGTALSRVMSKQGALAPTRVVHIASQICRGMQSAHDLGVVHRDLKPANVMLVEEEGDHDCVKILDFGVAKLTDDPGAQALTQTGALLGTLPFMAPEQIGGGTVDARTDIYALGILLYRMFTGMTVWDADSLGDIVRHQLSSTPPSMFERVTNARFTPALDAVVLKCLAKDPAHRYQSMQLLRLALDEALHAAKNPALARTFNDADDADDNGDDDRVDTLEVVPGQGGRVRSVDVREHGTSPTGNIPKDRLDKDGLPKPIAGHDSGGIDVFRDDTLVASATTAALISSSSSSLSSSSSSLPSASNASSLTVPSRPKQPLPVSLAPVAPAIDPRLLGPDEDSVVDGRRVDPQAPTLSRLEERPVPRPSPGLITAPDRLFPSVGAGPVAVTSSELPASFGGPTNARAPSSRSFTRGPRTPVKKGPIAAGAVVLFALLGIGLWQATTSTKTAPTTVIAPLPPVELAPPAPPAVVETKPVAPPVVEHVEPVVVEPAPEAAKKPASTPPTTTPTKKPTPKPADDGFVRVRTKDGG